MEPVDLLHKVLKVCEDRKANDIIAYDVRNKSVLADYYLFCSANSIAHMRAILQHLEKALKEVGVHPRSIEGVASSRWIIMDYNDVLIHIFHHDTRSYYNVEGLLDSPCLSSSESRSEEPFDPEQTSLNRQNP